MWRGKVDLGTEQEGPVDETPLPTDVGEKPEDTAEVTITLGEGEKMAVVISSEAVDEDTIEDLVLEQPDQVREEGVVGRSETEEQVVESPLQPESVEKPEETAATIVLEQPAKDVEEKVDLGTEQEIPVDETPLPTDVPGEKPEDTAEVTITLGEGEKMAVVISRLREAVGEN